MGLSRRFLNLMVNRNIPCIRSLCSIDLTLQEFFHSPPTTSTMGGGTGSSVSDAASACNLKKEQAGRAAMSMEEFKIPNPTFSFKTHPESYHWNINCLTLADRKVLCTDQSGRSFLFDADTSHLVTMPNLNKPKSNPISLVVPSNSIDSEHNHSSGGSIYIMETIPDPERGSSEQPSDQFEALFHNKPTMTSSDWQQIPPPLFVRDPSYWHTHPKITSYAMVGGGSQGPYICISVEEAGTYCMDTKSHTWTHIGKWTLPFHGKVEYEPELKLWFGISAESGFFAAADLSNISTMDSQPQLISDWKELDPLEDWEESQDPQIVNLGSGWFCIARYFETMSRDLIDQNIVVLTGVKVVPHVLDDSCSSSGSSGLNEEVDLEVTMLKSRYHISKTTTIEAVF